MKFSLNQRGFVAFDAVIVVIALVAIGTAGYFAYQSHQDKTDYSVNIPHKKPATVPAKPANEFDVPGLGIKMSLPNGLSASDLVYQLDTTSNTVADANGNQLTTFVTVKFSTRSLMMAGGKTSDYQDACTTEGMPLGAVVLLDRDPTGLAIASGPGLVKKIGARYLGIYGPQQICANNQTARQLQTQQFQLLKQALDTAELLN